MLELARTKIPADRLKDVDVINESFITAELAPQSFDLIVCVGVLAHVDSPAAVIAEIARLAKPGGSVIMEFTDSFHFSSVPIVLYQNVLKLLRPAAVHAESLSRRRVIGLCHGNSLRESALYRYGFPRSVSLKWPGKKRCIG